MAESHFKITNKAPDTLEIDIEGTIGTGWFDDGVTKEAIKNQLKDIAQSRASNIIVNINSYGGDVNHGISIHDLLAEHKAKVTTVIHGHTASAATIISQAGDVRKMSDNALFLIHPASILAWGNHNDISLALDDLKTIDESISNIYAKRTGKSKEEVKAIMERFEGRGEWLTASEAKELGFIDEIFEPMKAVASVDPEIFSKLHLPEMPLNKIKNQKSEEMKDKQTVFAWFKEFTDKLTGKKKEPEETPTEPVNETPETPPVNEVVIKDMDEVKTVLTDLTDQVEAKDNTIVEMTNKITTLENEVARLKGVPTKTKDKEDPFLDKGNLKTNEQSAQANAEALKTL
jgi:ATP-dependent protease ClpP protease subunit